MKNKYLLALEKITKFMTIILGVMIILLILYLLIIISPQKITDDENKNKDFLDIIDEVRLRRMGIPEDKIKDFPKQFGKEFQEQFEREPVKIVRCIK